MMARVLRRWWRDPQGGAALILALLMITVLVTVVIESLRGVQVEATGARYFQDGFRAEALAKSGVHLAMQMLAIDGADNEVDHLGEPWAEVLQPGMLPRSLAEAGTLEGKVVDENGKFPVNFLVDDKGALRPDYQQVFERLLTMSPMSLDAEKAHAVATALKDWLDKDEETTETTGAEADYYQTLEKPHGCRNGPIVALDELLLVRGITPELYYGKDGKPGLKDFVTVRSSGRININTAGVQVLQALVPATVAPETASEWAQNVVAYRSEPFHYDFLKEKDWYRNRMPGFNDIVLPAALVTTTSDYFSVEMTARVGAGRKSIFAYLEREPGAGRQGEAKVVARFWQVY
ncbi:MAG: type II secretion system minor pseudopilin GspK [Deltaproteobacteria bacterium]|nr:type II secretion system minor pseudopilin GspK [Deltaproteobacteria bacterium]